MTDPKKPPTLKLAKLPDRKPVKMMITLSAELTARLDAYAAAYKATYGDTEKVVTLIPFIIASFIEGDRGFKAVAGDQAD